MCGKRYGHGLRSTLILLLLALVLPWGLYSASALDEIIPILNSYVQITENLYDRSNVYEKEVSSFKIVTQELNKSLLTLELESSTQKTLVNSQMITLTEHETTLTDYSARINNLESGYLSMEKSLKLSKTIGNVSIGIAVGALVVSAFVLLIN